MHSREIETVRVKWKYQKQNLSELKIPLMGLSNRFVTEEKIGEIEIGQQKLSNANTEIMNKTEEFKSCRTVSSNLIYMSLKSQNKKRENKQKEEYEGEMFIYLKKDINVQVFLASLVPCKVEFCLYQLYQALLVINYRRSGEEIRRCQNQLYFISIGSWNLLMEEKKNGSRKQEQRFELRENLEGI